MIRQRNRANPELMQVESSAKDMIYLYPDVVDRRQIMNAATPAQAVAPKARYRPVLSGSGSSLRGKAVLGFVAASANAINSSLILDHLTVT